MATDFEIIDCFEFCLEETFLLKARECGEQRLRIESKCGPPIDMTEERDAEVTRICPNALTWILRCDQGPFL